MDATSRISTTRPRLVSRTPPSRRTFVTFRAVAATATSFAPTFDLRMQIRSNGCTICIAWHRQNTSTFFEQLFDHLELAR
jgi:hypothetical protein